MTKLVIDIPDSIERSLQVQFGPDLAHVAKEALAVAMYRAEKLSIGQVAELLGTSIYEAEGLMKRSGVDATLSLEEFERDRETLDRLLGP